MHRPDTNIRYQSSAEKKWIVASLFLNGCKMHFTGTTIHLLRRFYFLPTVLFIFRKCLARLDSATARIVAGQVCSGMSVLYLNRMTPSRVTTTSKHAGLSYKCPARKQQEPALRVKTMPQNTHINTCRSSKHVPACL